MISGEQISGDVVSGSGSGSSSGRVSSKEDPGDEKSRREARRTGFRNSIGAGLQGDNHLFHDTTPDGQTSLAHDAMELSQAVEGDEPGHEEDSNQVSEVDGAVQDGDSNEVSDIDREDYEDINEMSEAGEAEQGGDSNEVSGIDGADQEDDDNNYNEETTPAYQGWPSDPPSGTSNDGDDYSSYNEDYTPTPAYENLSSDPPSGSSNDLDDDNFAARLTTALEALAENAASSSDVEIPDSQAGSDDPVLDVNGVASSIEMETAAFHADSHSDSFDNKANDAALSSDEEVPDSQADSEDLVIRSDNETDEPNTTVVHHRTTGLLAPRSVPRPVRAPPNDSDSDSSLSDLEKTPEPVDPELTRLDREYRRRNIKFCNCLGWCECSRHSTFYGSVEGGVGEAVPWVMPSQTHLSEATLAHERFPTSAMRSTIRPHQRYEERVVALSWDQRRRPVRAPAGWVGGEWEEFPGGYKRATVEEAPDAGD